MNRLKSAAMMLYGIAVVLAIRLYMALRNAKLLIAMAKAAGVIAWILAVAALTFWLLKHEHFLFIFGMVATFYFGVLTWAFYVAASVESRESK